MLCRQRGPGVDRRGAADCINPSLSGSVRGEPDQACGGGTKACPVAVLRKKGRRRDEASGDFAGGDMTTRVQATYPIGAVTSGKA